MPNIHPIKPLTPEQVKLSDFDLFWECYPRPRNKLDARKAWQQVTEHRPDIEAILAACNRLREQCPDLQYCPYPATWLRKGGFLDD